MLANDSVQTKTPKKPEENLRHLISFDILLFPKLSLQYVIVFVKATYASPEPHWLNRLNLDKVPYR